MSDKVHLIELSKVKQVLTDELAYWEEISADSPEIYTRYQLANFRKAMERIFITLLTDKSNSYINAVEKMIKDIEINSLKTKTYEEINDMFNQLNDRLKVAETELKSFHLHDNNILHPNIEKLVRYTIKQWSSLNEQREPDHEYLVNNWLNGDCKEWLKNNNF